MAGKGGARPGAGRKKKDIKLGLDLQKNTAEMVQQKLRLLSRLHNEDIIDDYCKALAEMIRSENKGERRDAVKIITDILLKTDTPNEVQAPETKVRTAEILVNKLRKERAESAASEDGEEQV